MDSIQLRQNFSRNMLLRMLILTALGAGILLWQLDFIASTYFRNQLTGTGLVINGAILGLFILGMLKMITIFFKYSREERTLQCFIRNIEEEKDNPLLGLGEDTIISQRYRIIKALHHANTPINHNALASTLVASESTCNSFPKFINNILILTGVFGTIVSLSIALIGASDMLASTVEIGGMGMVVHGMSTALSTTITAILCYLFFGYFYLKLTDVQTNLVSAVEQVTNNYLIPRFQVQTDNVLCEFTGLIRSLQDLVNQMGSSQENFGKLEEHLMGAVDVYYDKIGFLSKDMNEIKELLTLGFRLPEHSQNPEDQ